MKFHPINYACSLDFSTGLETLLRTGFRIPDGTDSALSQVLCQFSGSCAYQALQKCSSHVLTPQTFECIDLPGQYGYTFRVGLKADTQLCRYLNNAFYHTIVQHPNPKGLSQLLELGANPTVGPGETPYLLTALGSHCCKAIKQQYTGYSMRFGFFHGRRRGGLVRSSQRIPYDCTCKVKDVANILIVANCDVKLWSDCSKFKTSALSLAILRFPSLIFPLLKAGMKIKESSHCENPVDFSCKNDIQLAEERLSGKFLCQFLSFVHNEDGIKMSLKFQCRIFIRNYLGICTYRKLMQTGLPMQLVSYLMLNG